MSPVSLRSNPTPISQAETARCLALLCQVELILRRHDEGVLAAHLSLVSGRLHERMRPD